MELARFALAWTVAVVSAFYLMNPTGGQREFLPDTMRYWGNLDELVAGILLLSALRYFGVDVCRFFARKQDDERPE